MFLSETEICNFADDTTLHASDMSLDNVLKSLERDGTRAVEWFSQNTMKLNDSKCHLLVSGHKFEHVSAVLGEARIWESDSETLLGVKIDNKLNFTLQGDLLIIN